MFKPSQNMYMCCEDIVICATFRIELINSWKLSCCPFKFSQVSTRAVRTSFVSSNGLETAVEQKNTAAKCVTRLLCLHNFEIFNFFFAKRLTNSKPSLRLSDFN